MSTKPHEDSNISRIVNNSIGKHSHEHTHGESFNSFEVEVTCQTKWIAPTVASGFWNYDPEWLAWFFNVGPKRWNTQSHHIRLLLFPILLFNHHS